MRWVVLLGLATACGTTPVLPPTVPVERRVEDVPLPPDPTGERLEDFPSDDEWAYPVEVGECMDENGWTDPSAPRPCPDRAGIQISEAKAARALLIKTRYVELRKLYEADRSVWRGHRELYEERLKLADEAIQKLQPGWWTRNKFPIGVVGGFLLGAVITVTGIAVAD